MDRTGDMKRAFAIGATLFLLCTAPAMSQVYPGEEVTVNPAALGSGYLLYPGGKYGRHVGLLLMPGEKPGPIRLHMPVRHPHVARRNKKAAPVVASAPASDAPTSPDQFASAPDMTATAPPPPKKIARPAPAKPAPAKPAPTQTAAAEPPSDLSSMPEDSAARLVGPMSANLTPPAPPPAKPRKAPAKPAAPAPANDAAPTEFKVRVVPDGRKPARTASTTPPPAATAPAAVATGLRKQGSIPFSPGASNPATSDANGVHALATALNAQLNAGAQHVQLNAYGGPRGDKSSDSHRLALKRALVIRELLIEDGVPAEKIDVRALGGVDDSGPADRVDIFVGA